MGVVYADAGRLAKGIKRIARIIRENEWVLAKPAEKLTGRGRQRGPAPARLMHRRRA